MKIKKAQLKALVMVVAVALLIIISGVQAVEIAGLKSKMSSGAAAFSGQDSGSAAATLQKSLQSLPQMVGGC